MFWDLIGEKNCTCKYEDGNLLRAGIEKLLHDHWLNFGKGDSHVISLKVKKVECQP